MHAINSGFTVTKIKTMLQITYMCNQCMESVNQNMVDVKVFTLQIIICLTSLANSLDRLQSG
jgi:hypothetical protein